MNPWSHRWEVHRAHFCVNRIIFINIDGWIGGASGGLTLSKSIIGGAAATLVGEEVGVGVPGVKTFLGFISQTPGTLKLTGIGMLTG